MRYFTLGGRLSLLHDGEIIQLFRCGEIRSLIEDWTSTVKKAEGRLKNLVTIKKRQMESAIDDEKIIFVMIFFQIYQAITRRYLYHKA
jgi:hypothetical protein